MDDEDLAIWNAQKAEANLENDNYTVISQNKSAVTYGKSNFDVNSALSQTRNSMISRVTQISMLEQNLVHEKKAR